MAINSSFTINCDLSINSSLAIDINFVALSQQMVDF